MPPVGAGSRYTAVSIGRTCESPSLLLFSPIPALTAQDAYKVITGIEYTRPEGVSMMMDAHIPKGSPFPLTVLPGLTFQSVFDINSPCTNVFQPGETTPKL